MTAKIRLSGYLGPLLVVITIVAVAIWLSSGSSNQAQQRGWTNGWKETTSFQLARRAPAAAAYQNFIYIVGGIDANDRYVRPVEYASILNDGTLGKWQRTSPIIEGRFYNAAIAHRGYLYTLGGGSGATGEANYPIASVERARINEDGSLGSWQTVSQMQTPRRGLKALLHNNTIYAIGGYDGRFLKSVERATLLNDGSLTSWQMEPHESIIDRYIHSATVSGKVVYLLGGHMRSPNQASYSDVESSHIQTDGQLTAWQIQQHGLITSRLVAEAFSLGSFIYIAGGHSGNQRLSSVEVARINTDGTLEQWRNTAPLPVARSAYAATTYRDRVYLLGGGGNGQPLQSVHMASANLRGDLGHAQQTN